MCLLFCFVLFWILCCVVCKKIKIKIVDNKKTDERAVSVLAIPVRLPATGRMLGGLRIATCGAETFA